jgi:hypothetical protein
MQQGRVFAADGRVIRDGFDRMFPHPGADAAGVRNNIAQALHVYATTPARLSARSVLYFEKTVALMQSFGAAPPVIISAPVDRRIMAAIANRGWSVRQGLLLRFLGAVLAVDPSMDRYPPYLAAIARSRRQAWVFPRPSTLSALNAAVGAHPWLPDRALPLAGFRAYLRQHDIAYRSENAGLFTIVLPASAVALPSVAAAIPVEARAQPAPYVPLAGSSKTAGANRS